MADTKTTLHYTLSRSRLLTYWMALAMSTAGVRCVAALAREPPLLFLCAQQRCLHQNRLCLALPVFGGSSQSQNGISRNEQRTHGRFDTCGVTGWRHRSDRLSPLRASTSADKSSTTTTLTNESKQPTRVDLNNSETLKLENFDADNSTVSETESSSSLLPTASASWKKRWRRRTGSVFSALGFVISSTRALGTDPRTQFQTNWKPTVEALRDFLERSGIDLEIAAQLNVRLMDNLIILSRVERASLNGTDRRDLALLSSFYDHNDNDSATLLWRPPSTDKALRYMRFATSTYGDAMIRAAEMDVLGKFDSRLSSFDKISEHTGIPEVDIVSVDLDYGGNSNHLRHFVAVDHAHRRIVLAIRGTFTISEIVVDAAGFSRKFCGGEAHSEMATMAERLWDVVGPTILNLLEDNPTYTLTLTGHSLGGGVAGLLNIFLHQNGGEHVRGRFVECFTFAAPPTFTSLESVPRQALEASINYINERDVVPFLSVDSVRHLFNCVRAIEEQTFSWTQRMKLMSGYTEPDQALIDAVRQANENRLVTKPGAPVLVVPAKANIWLHEDSETGAYDAKVCESSALAKLGILIDAKMLEDHLPSRYEHAFYNMKE